MPMLNCSRYRTTILIPVLTALLAPVCAWATPFRCAPTELQLKPGIAGKPVATAAATSDQRAAIVIFSHFADENQPSTPPDWSSGLLDPDRPGSVAHFYDSMSIGRHQLRGQVAPRRYTSADPGSAYLPVAADEPGGFGRFVLDILRQADIDIDFSNFDNDGPDGHPNSGDDDGIVDAIFVNLATIPSGFLFRDATGIADLGFDLPLTTDDPGINGAPIRIDPANGMIQEAPNLAAAAGVMAHEYGHLLGLPDLFNVEWTDSPAEPEHDSAGIGHWGLMGWGALGWPDTPGPNSLSAWSRLRLGWAQVLDIQSVVADVELEPVAEVGQVSRVPLNGNEYFLLEYRRRDASFYDRGIPGDGLLIWHVRRAEVDGELSFAWDIDLECADGLWLDAGYPLGRSAAPRDGSDNLDFWAHDADYRSRQGGNQGDVTDLFDGVTFNRFAADTNPAAVSSDGANSVAIEQIALQGDLASFTIRNSPPVLMLSDVTPRSPRVIAGASMAITFHLANESGTPASNLTARLRSQNDALEILTPEIPLYALPGGASSVGRGVGSEGFPRIRFPADLTNEQRATIELTIYTGDEPVATATLVVTGVPGHQIDVEVDDDEGSPVAEIEIVLTAVSTDSDVFFEKQAITDRAGSAAFHVPAGSYNLLVTPDIDGPWGPAELRGTFVAAHVQVELVLPRAYGLSGIVRLANGDPATDIYVTARAVDGRTHYAQTDHQGLVPSRFGAVLSGRVFAPDDQMPQLSLVYAYEPSLGLLAELPAGSDGEYSLALPFGTYEIALLDRTDGEFRLAYRGGPVELSRDRVFDIRLDVDTAIEDAQGAPHRFALEQNYPNPFNAETVIEFSTVTDGDVRLVLYDLLGQRVRTLLRSELPAGPSRIQWDGTDDAGHTLASGIYLYRLTTPTRSASKKLLLLR